MSLYEDLPQARDGSNGARESSWAAPKLQPTFRKPSILAPPPSLLRAGRGAGRGATTPGRGLVRTPSGDSQQGPPSATLSSIFSATIKDEYDPARPNDYEEIIREREQRNKEAQMEEERQAMLRDAEREEEDRRQRQQEEAEHSNRGFSDEGRKNTEEDRAKALNISGEEAWMRRAALSGRAPPPPLSFSGDSGPSGRDVEDNGGGSGFSAPSRGMNLAKNLLQKMGWKEGEGLGKNRQGISAPLVAQKTGKRGGIVVQEEAKVSAGADEGNAEKKPRGGAIIQGKPSRVLSLRNMVGPGEVDEELEDEVAQECLKYGQVVSVLIFEVTTPGFAPEEAVRIFIQFDRIESATKAMVDMQGRFFGGRHVRAAFFSEDRFASADLAPAPGEFDA